MSRSGHGIFIILVVALQGSFCACLSPKRLVKGQVLTLRVHIDENANADQPVAFDVVSANDKALAQDLMKMTAGAWFDKRTEIRENYPKPSDLTVSSWEWVPGQQVKEVPIRMRRPPRILLIFADYATPGPHRARLVPGKPIDITLTAKDFQISTVK
jgi:type VI secretion system protein